MESLARNNCFKCLVISLVLLFSITINLPLVYADNDIIWLDSHAGKIQRTQSGSTITLKTGLKKALALTLGDSCRLYYWNDNQVYKTAPTISAATTLFQSVYINARDLAETNSSQVIVSNAYSLFNTTITDQISPSALEVFKSPVSKLYWLDIGHRPTQFASYDAIRRSNLDWTSPQTIQSTIAGRGLAIDEASDWVYWAENKNPATIKRMRNDGTGVQTVLSTGLTYVTHLAFGGARLYAMDVDGTIKIINPQIPSISTLISGIEVAGGIAVLPGDTDGDLTSDCDEGCPTDPAKLNPGLCGCGVADTDTDSDGTPNCNDQCPNNSGKIAPGTCGCGAPDVDSDGDGALNCQDACLNDPLKTAAGICGCGTADTDTDGDGTPNCNDQCPNDTGKITPGTCGCGAPDIDSDGDGVLNCQEACFNDPLKTAAGICGCGTADTDTDGDGTPNCNDQCPNNPNKSQAGKCGCNQIEIVDGNNSICSSDRQINESITPEPATVSPRGSCQVSVSFEPLAVFSGSVRYNLTVSNENSSRNFISSTQLPNRFLFKVPRAGRYELEYRAVLLRNQRRIFQSKLSKTTKFEVTSNNCRAK